MRTRAGRPGQSRNVFLDASHRGTSCRHRWRAAAIRSSISEGARGPSGRPATRTCRMPGPHRRDGRDREFLADSRRPSPCACCSSPVRSGSARPRSGSRDGPRRGIPRARARPVESETPLGFAALGDLFAELAEPSSTGCRRRSGERCELRCCARTPVSVRPISARLQPRPRRASCLAGGPVLLAIDDLQWLDPATGAGAGLRPAPADRRTGRGWWPPPG